MYRIVGLPKSGQTLQYSYNVNFHDILIVTSLLLIDIYMLMIAFSGMALVWA